MVVQSSEEERNVVCSPVLAPASCLRLAPTSGIFHQYQGPADNEQLGQIIESSICEIGIACQLAARRCGIRQNITCRRGGESISGHMRSVGSAAKR